MEKKSLFSSFIIKLRDNKKLEIALYAALAALAAVIFLASGGISCNGNAPAPKAEPAAVTEADPERALEARLEAILERIEGAGEVCVLITLESGRRVIPAEETSLQGGTESRKPITVSNGGSQGPVILAELMPAVRGAVIVAKGAADPRVRDRLRAAAVTALGASPECVSVFPMN